MSKPRDPDLYAEALSVLAQSEILRETVIWQDEQVERLCHKYSEEELDEMPEEEKLAHLAECEEICGRLNQSVKELRELDKRYNAVREKVRAKYGKDALPPIPPSMPGEIDPEGEIDLL